MNLTCLQPFSLEPSPLFPSVRLLDGSASSLLEGLVDLWCYDPDHAEGVGGDSGDTQGNWEDNHLTEAGGLTLADYVDVGGGAKWAHALAFTAATSDRMGLADATKLRINSGSHTFAVWVKLTTLTGTRPVFAKKTGGTAIDYELSISAADGFQWSVWRPDGAYEIVQADALPVTGTWYLLVCGWDDDAGAPFLYLDAVDQGAHAFAAGSYSANGFFAIGTDNAGNMFNGTLEALAHWERRLTSEEIDALLTASLADAVPVDEYSRLTEEGEGRVDEDGSARESEDG